MGHPILSSEVRIQMAVTEKKTANIEALPMEFSVEWTPRERRCARGGHDTCTRLKRKKKGPVEPEKEEEEDRLESFFCHLHEFHNPVRNVPSFVPAELPPRYAINFVPAIVFDSPVVPASPAASLIVSAVHNPVRNVPGFVPATVSAPPVVPASSAASLVVPASAINASSVVSDSDFSVISSINFVPVSAFNSCIDSTL